MKFLTIRLLCLAALLVNLAACTPSAPAADQAQPVDGVTRPAGWSDETHGETASPNYEVVFPQEKVNQLTIEIDPAAWETMQANMTALYGEPGKMSGPGAGFDAVIITRTDMLSATAGMMPFPGGLVTGTAGMMPFHEGVVTGTDGIHRDVFAGGPGLGENGKLSRDNPQWITATLQFEGRTWSNVGVRYKGNSSLMSSWSRGDGKLPFKLDFDEFEKDYPEIENQRFYGFKQLSLANNLGDPTGMRETIAYDLLGQSGLPAAQTAAYEIFLDHGDGPRSLGLYTMIEVIDDTVVDRYFSDDSGNIYEGDGRAASLASGTKEKLKDSFQKENNSSQADWSDIEKLYDVLHSPERTSDPAAWRASLEAIFDVPSFLKWLGISAFLEHWDTYGAMTHNFYLYNNPATGKLSFISWDHNFVLGGNMGGGASVRHGPAGVDNLIMPADPNAPGNQAVPAHPAPPGNQVVPADPNGPDKPRVEIRIGGMGMENMTFDRKNIDASWPLIRYLLDDPTYYAAYIATLRETSATVLKTDALVEKYSTLAQVIGPVAAKESSQTEYDAAVEELKTRIRTRATDLATFLAAQ